MAVLTVKNVSSKLANRPPTRPIFRHSNEFTFLPATLSDYREVLRLQDKTRACKSKLHYVDEYVASQTHRTGILVGMRTAGHETLVYDACGWLLHAIKDKVLAAGWKGPHGGGELMLVVGGGCMCQNLPP